MIVKRTKKRRVTTNHIGKRDCNILSFGCLGLAVKVPSLTWMVVCFTARHKERLCRRLLGRLPASSLALDDTRVQIAKRASDVIRSRPPARLRQTQLSVKEMTEYLKISSSARQ